MGIHLARALSLSDENGQDNENIRDQKRRRAHNETGTISLLFKKHRLEVMTLDTKSSADAKATQLTVCVFIQRENR